MTRTFCNICGKEIKPAYEGKPNKLTFKIKDIDGHFCSLDCLHEGLEKWFEPRSPRSVTIDYEWGFVEADHKEGEEKI